MSRLAGLRRHGRTDATPPGDGYRWIALSNTTMAVFMSALDGSIVIIALPAIFRGIHLDPLGPGNIGFLLWMIMGYRLVQAVLVVTVGRLGDMYGRVRIYNAGFAVFTLASVLLSFDPFQGADGALWLIGWRVLQALGGSMLMANSAAILTDAFPTEQRGFALGINQVAAIAGQFIGLVAGGLLAAVDWRAIFWVNVPVGVFGTIWAYRRLREVGERHRGRIDWWGNLTFAVGLSAVLIAVTYGIQPYGGATMGWANPAVIAGLAGGTLLLVAFVAIERSIAEPMFSLGLFRIRAFAAGSAAGLIAAAARGGLQFMLIIWLQGIWLPLHGYDYSDTPLWAGVYLLPLTAAFLVSGPVSGLLSDRFGSRSFATAGMLVFGASFIGLMLLPVNFPYWAFAALIVLNGLGVGMFGAPNSSSIMGSVPARQRGAASGMRSTFQNTGTALSIGVFFSLMIAGLSSTLPRTLFTGLRSHGVAPAVAHRIAGLPPVSSLFAAVLGDNPIAHLLGSGGSSRSLAPGARAVLTGREFFPQLIAGPFHDGLVVVFLVGAALSLLAAIASGLRGGRPTPAPPGHSRPATCRLRRPDIPTQQGDTVPLSTLDPQSALIVIDLQTAIKQRFGDAGLDDVLAATAGLARAFRAHNRPVVLVNVDAGAPGRTDEGRSIGTLPPEALEILPELEPGDDDIRVTKQTWGAFHGTGLDDALRDRGVTQVVITGVATSAGVESTARAAHEHGYHVVLATDAMADRDPDVHRHSVERIFPRLGETATSAEIIAAVQQAG